MAIINTISLFVMPVMVGGILVFGLIKKVNLYDCFIDGAKNGLETSIRILAPLVALLVAVGMLRASGALDFILNMLSPVTNLLHIPKEVMPLALMRPISGSAALAIVTDNLSIYGPDSMVGRITSVMMGSTETTFYTLAVYFGCVSIKNSRHTVKAALFADLTGILCSVFFCSIFFQ